ncbi:Major Facilitator Superfamily [Dehalogenimonas alkenigignens]|uniref:Major Facilitator Superfamily n=2 Tax=Dehalogenimonas alkenigignens TaxID=1217799 RepID=A0A0W0GH84_9CHLR|nr:Major Facilitator Superfamily [Dehalogenimonas alkenigignens]
MALISPFAGRLADRLEPRLIASGGMALSAAGLLMLAFIGQDTSLVYLMAALVVIGAGFGFFSSPNTSAVMGAVERKCYGVAASTLGTMRLVRQMLSLGLAMLLFALIIGRVPISAAVLPEFIDSLRASFTLFAVLSLAGVAASLARNRIAGAA